MTALHWTSEPPTRTGWYKILYEGKCHYEEVEITNGELCINGITVKKLSESGVQFAMPIPRLEDTDEIR